MSKLSALTIKAPIIDKIISYRRMNLDSPIQNEGGAQVANIPIH